VEGAALQYQKDRATGYYSINQIIGAEINAAMPETPIHNITGVILVGGKSRRMGRDKAFLEVAGKPLIERVLEVFRESFAQVVLVGDRAELFADYGLPILPDIFPGSSLGGLYTGLHYAETEYVFVSSCDIPFPNAEILRYICSQKDGFDAVVPSTPLGYEPLFALYSKSCLVPIRTNLENGEFCAYAYYPQIHVRYVLSEELAHFDRDGRAFVNINTPEEFARIPLRSVSVGDRVLEMGEVRHAPCRDTTSSAAVAVL
jgi:molybdopterin-guanine dinucleotide biosynthesis protein A